MRIGRRTFLCKMITLCFGVLTTATFTGCSSLVYGAESLLRPPRLSQQQAAINEALYAKVGRDIKLKYPKTGERRSAIMVEDMDGDGSMEAIAFYEKTGNAKSGVRMNLLTEQSDKWVSLFDYAGVGAELETVLLENMSDDKDKVLIVGYGVPVVGQGNKTLRVFSYSEKQLTQIQESSYAELAVIDLNTDGRKELITFDTLPSEPQKISALSAVTQTAKSRPQAKMYQQSQQNKELVLVSQTDLDDGVIDYTFVATGNVSANVPAVYLDGRHVGGSVQTQILYCVEGQIKNPLFLNTQEMVRTTRPAQYRPIDVDQDGIKEIPTFFPAPGYESVAHEEQVMLTDWLVYDRFGMSKKYTGFYSAAEGYAFLLPARWQGAVTVRVSSAKDEAVFLKYDGGLENSQTELLRIRVVAKGDGERERLLENGWKYFEANVSPNSISPNDYLYKSPGDPEQPLELTEMEVNFNFYIL